MKLVPVEDMPEKTRQMIQGSGPTNSLNINKMMAHAETCVRHYMRLGSALLSQLQLDPVLRELAILRVATLCDSDYERLQHEKIARTEGVSEEKISSVRIGINEPCFSEAELLVLKYTEEVTKQVKSTEETFQKLTEVFTQREIAELTLVIGFYNMVARFLENTEVQMED
jgi:alkylhydroperoxidase family enzyme